MNQRNVLDILDLPGTRETLNIAKVDGYLHLETSDPHLQSLMTSGLRRLGMRVATSGSRTLISTEDTDQIENVKSDLKKKLLKWRAHTQENATAGGYRKAGKRKVDARVFAMEMANLAFSAAEKHGSVELKSLGRSLLKASKANNPRIAEQILSELGEDTRPRDFTPTIQKPAGVSPALDPSPSTEAVEESYAPSTTNSVSTGGDNSWSSETASRKSSINYELAGLAEEFLHDYMSNNGVSDPEDLREPTISEAWEVDLQSKGKDADPDEVAQAWESALNALTGGTDTEDPFYTGQEDGITESPVGSKRANIPQMAPGGDYFNQIVDHESSMMNSITSKKASKGDTAKAVDQCLDHYSGEMLPGEISLADVKNFTREEFPRVDPEDVYEIIGKLSEPRHRHDDDEKEEETPKKKESSHWDNANSAKKASNPLDGFLKKNRQACSSQVACKACKGQGVLSSGTCETCAGKGRTSRQTSFRNSDSGLKVAVNLTSRAHKGVLGKFLGTRIASDRITLHHSTKLMQTLESNGIPYATTEFQHPFFRSRVRKAKIDWKPVNWNLFEQVPWNQLPWSVKAGVEALGLGRSLDSLTLRKFAAALKSGNPVLEQKTGRTAQEILQEMNDFLMNEGRSGNRIAKKVLNVNYLAAKKQERTLKRANLLLKVPSESEE